MKTIGILITGHLPSDLVADYGSYADLFTELLGDHDFSFRRYTVVDGEFPKSPAETDGWLITGSKHGVYEDHPWIGMLENFIRAAHEANVPMVGICFGHQIMAKAMGGTVEKFKGGWSVGSRTYHRKDNGQQLTALAFHQDQVISAPPSAEIIADSDNCEIAMLRYGDWGLSYQPHPEFQPSFFKDLTESRSTALPHDVYQSARKIDQSLSTEDMATEIATFLSRNR